MGTIIDFLTERIWLIFIIGLILLPFVILLVRKLTHLAKLLGLYPHAKRRPQWTRCDMTADEVAVYLQFTAGQHQVRKDCHNKSIDYLHWAIYMRLQTLRRRLSRAPASIISLVPASQWFFDNYNLFYKELMKLQNFGNLRKYHNMPILSAPVAGYPRIWLLAREIVSCSDYHLNEKTITDMLSVYQVDHPLLARELWALPEMLILCLLEKSTDESRQVLRVIDVKRQADRIAEKIAARICVGNNDIGALLKKEVKPGELRDKTFISHLYFRMKGMSVNEDEITSWLASALQTGQVAYLAEFRSLIEQEEVFEAEAEALIRSLVISLKVIVDVNWDEQLQRVSALETLLSADPAGIYPRMDDQTRSLYRFTVEKLAKDSHLQETTVAEQIISWANLPPADFEYSRPDHIGSYLTGKGLIWTTAHFGGHNWLRKFIAQYSRPFRIAVYYTGIVMLTGLMIAAGLLMATMTPDGTVPGTGLMIALGLLLTLVGSSISIHLLQQISASLVRTNPQLAMDFHSAIPDQFRTLVVMPVIMNSEKQVIAYIDRLEKHYLANRQENLYFALLGDFSDADTETTPTDEGLTAACEAAIHQLNTRYPDIYTRFYLLNRPRLWNASENTWMGWERKRGKLEELNALLMGESDTSFIVRKGDPVLLNSFKFVITLDSDTELIRESAAKLVGIMAHPLNWPQIDEKTQRVVSGYAIVQPEIRNRIPGPSASIFARFFSGQTGIDPYSTVASDIYQDVFDEGTFVGKGIYDIQVMNSLLRGNIPENSVLSHDLLEGSLSRCAFASSVKLMDTQPSGIVSYIRREHRWIRGDWQLLPWLPRTSAINWLSRWKIIDNLRRSLIQPASLILILLCSLALPATPWLWLPFICFDSFYGIVSLTLRIIIQKNRNPSMRLAIRALWNQLVSRLILLAIEIMLIPIRGILAVDAIIRTIYRLLVSHKKMLEWQTAESIERAIGKSLRFHFKVMWPVVFPAAAMVLSTLNQSAIISEVFLLMVAALWLLSPLFSWSASLQVRHKEPGRVQREQNRRLRLLARRTWNYFEDFSTPKTHWLCPDNFQKYPGPKTSDKTSPTNIGLQLLSTLAARDMGYIGLQAMVDKLEKIMMIVQKLPKWNGHLYNWYQINPLQIIEPQYVSTVDSGNFFAHLIALRQGLADLHSRRIFGKANVAGLNDTLVAAGLDGHQYENTLPTLDEWMIMLNNLKENLKSTPTDEQWKTRINLLCESLLSDSQMQDNTGGWYTQKTLDQLAADGCSQVVDLLSRVDELCGSIEKMVHEADFKALYDYQHQLFMIGYHVSSQTADSGRYDLMASEARLSSFLAIAKGDVSQKHWFALGRPFTLINGTPTLLSWSGSMFEYLMPNIVLKTPPGSIFSDSCRAAVSRQIDQGRRMKLPWGISESQYYAFDVNSNYQYTAFGVMRLRLQSTVRPAQVIAPYATLLALMVKPKQALRNIDRLRQIGAEGDYGFFEALDYNRPDSANLRPFSLVQTSMVHHLGMSLTAIDNYLNQNIMQTRFHREPMIQAAEILLEETSAVGLISVSRRWYTININAAETEEETPESRYVVAVDPPEPIAHVLANRQYMVMMTSDGEGFSRCDNTLINRWRADPLGSGYGSFIYLRDLDSDTAWSCTYRPTRKTPDHYQVVFSPDKIEYNRKDGDISTRMEVTLSPQENLEVRRVTLTNHSDKTVNMELTSYLEVVADQYRSDVAHPAFSKLFIETEFIKDQRMLVASRRLRSPGDKKNFVLHRIVAEHTLRQNVQFEIDRRQFIGRNGTLILPQVMESKLPLSSRTGFSPDPILSLRAVVGIPAGHSATLVFLTGYGQSREDILQLSAYYDKFHDSDDVFRMSLTSSRLKMKYLAVRPSQLNAIQSLVSSIYYPSLTYRGPVKSMLRNQLGQSGLWRFGISGDNPIMLLQVSELKSAPLINDVLLAFEVLRVHHVEVDLVIFNDEESGYAMELNQLIQSLTSRLRIFSGSQAGASLFTVNRFQLSSGEIDLLFTVAALIFTPASGIYFRNLKGPDAKQEKQIAGPAKPAPQAVIQLSAGKSSHLVPAIESYPEEDQPLEYFNGLGGFAKDGSEYVIRIRSGMKPPSPWINVIANDQFGFLVSETGAGYTWAGNSHENKLTTWSNDPVLDPISEAIYIRDEITGAITSPCLLNSGFGGHYQIRHGFGYSTFEHDELEIRQTMTVFAAAQAPVKIWLLTLSNPGPTERPISVTLYVEWLLGVSRDQSAPYTITEFDQKNDCLVARNSYNDLYRKARAFIFSSEKVTSCTGSRKEFLGTSISARYPQGLSLPGFSGTVGAGIDPCGVIQVCLTLAPGETRSLLFGLGQTAGQSEIAELIKHFRVTANCREELGKVREYWDKKLGGVEVHTPDRTLDILMNGWLHYQVLSCRIKARAAFYQCGGAFGYRDQLQDTLAFLDSDPGLARRQILICCSRQFTDGDVQHWWHPPTGVGVRTRITDDMLWLPYVTAEYLKKTGDLSILSEKTSWLEGERLLDNQHEVMITPQSSTNLDTVYQHCLKAIERAAQFGSNGLPLMGGGDWNDGMNLVGVDGRGESVWLGWFLYSVLHRFISICKENGDVSNSRRMASMAANLTGNLESSAWDGQWYLRAFFDNGHTMGSNLNEECQIDSISQSWAVLSGAGSPVRAAKAIESARERLVKDDDRMILLLSPPFDKSADNPGYIRGYYPGVRENGGQYTHGAIWLAMATAQLKQTSEAWRLLGLLNPIWSTIDLKNAYRYEKEPYVMSADISLADPLRGRAGWSWYTGSAGWMYQAILHSYLGIQRHNDKMVIDPCVPASWKSYRVSYKAGSAVYQMTMVNKSGPGIHVQAIMLDGAKIDGNQFDLIDDGKNHQVEIWLSDKKR